MMIRFVVMFVLLAVASLPLSGAERADILTPAACVSAAFTPAQAGSGSEEAAFAQILPRPQLASTDPEACCVPCRGGWICGTPMACCPFTLECCYVP